MEREELLKKIKSIVVDKLSISEDQITEEKILDPESH